MYRIAYEVKQSSLLYLMETVMRYLIFIFLIIVGREIMSYIIITRNNVSVRTTVARILF